MEFFKIRKDIPFMRHALVFNVISLVTFLLAVFFLGARIFGLGAFTKIVGDRGRTVADNLKIVENQLASRPYIAGNAFTMGDIPVGCFVHRWFALDVERPDLRNLKAWYARLKARPAYAKHIMIPLT